MSDRMSVAEWRSAMRAIRPTDTHITMKRVDVERASRTIVHQAEQIERLQNALRTVIIGVEGLGLWPQDMEAPE